MLAMLACRPAAVENKEDPPEQVSVAERGVLPGKVEGGFLLLVG